MGVADDGVRRVAARVRPLEPDAVIASGLGQPLTNVRRYGPAACTRNMQQVQPTAEESGDGGAMRRTKAAPKASTEVKA
jgi:hypothetical protein